MGWRWSSEGGHSALTLTPLPQERGLNTKIVVLEDPKKIKVAKELRRAATAAEKRAWDLLRNRALLELKFRRQHVFRGFVLDFYCDERKVALELDGPVHNSAEVRCYDQRRDEILERAGITTIRLKNHEVSRGSLVKLLRPLLRSSK